MTTNPTIDSPKLRYTLEQAARKAQDIENSLFSYREYYLADKETSRLYDQISPGLNTPFKGRRKEEWEVAMSAAIARRDRAEYFIKQGELA